MKFSVASLIALIALFSQGLAASAQSCASYYRPLPQNHADNIHFQVVGPMYVPVNLWPWNILTQLLFLSYTQALAMWVQDNVLSATIILKRF